MTNHVLLPGVYLPSDGDSPLGGSLITQAINQLTPYLKPVFSTTGERDSHYAAWVAVPGNTLLDGMECSAGGVPYRRIAGVWRINRPRIVKRSNAPFSTITTGNTSTLTLASFTVYEAGRWKFDAEFRAGKPGAAICVVLIDNVAVGNQGISRDDEGVGVTGAVDLSAATHTLKVAVTANSNNVGWQTTDVTLMEGIAE